LTTKLAMDRYCLGDFEYKPNEKKVLLNSNLSSIYIPTGKMMFIWSSNTLL